MEILETFSQVFCFPKSRINETVVIVSNTAIQLQVNLRAGGFFFKGRSLNIGREGMVASINNKASTFFEK